MIFTETKIPGAYLIEPERHEDNRGFFARAFCQNEFEQQGLCSRFVQSSISFNRKKGTLRGMHYQAAPHQEIKLIRCTRGAICDVIVDIRADSPQFRQWCAVDLTEGNCIMLYVPKGVAHGFVSLEDNTELFYQMSESYNPESSRGFRWDDPEVGIDWPAFPEYFLSDRDRTFPFLKELA
ncbi:MAG: dTDP-4-dehydrorhamnose 3,5-epimerase [Phycisphaerae bacterium]|nr:dTDP-4-dehydrorhamnose 3,5-epimerase [Phycisphaerae bacterium]